MTKLTDLPIHDPDPERTAQRVREELVMHGTSAYIVGLSVDRCPPFNVDMAASWRIGWYNAHEKHWLRNQEAASRRCPKECHHHHEDKGKETCK